MRSFIFLLMVPSIGWSTVPTSTCLSLIGGVTTGSMKLRLYRSIDESYPSLATILSRDRSDVDFGPLMNSNLFAESVDDVLKAQADFFAHLEGMGLLNDSKNLPFEAGLNLFQQFNHHIEIFERGQGVFRLFLFEEELLSEWSQRLIFFKSKLVAYLQSNNGSSEPLYVDLSRWFDESTEMIESLELFFNLGLSPTLKAEEGESLKNFQIRVEQAIQERRDRWDALNLQRFAVRSPSR